MTPLKAEQQAADRLLQKAVRRSLVLVRNGHDPRPVLAIAERGAGLLLGEDVA